MSKQGFIKLHRQIQDHWLYQEERKFSKFEAWVDMLMLANHKDNKFLLGNELIEVERGSFITSELKLMERWSWGKSKTRDFLKLLESDGMIVKKSDRKKTTITICKYGVYHDNGKEFRPQADHEQIASRPRADTNKNDKNVKNEKKRYLDYVLLTDDEYNRLTNDYGKEIVDSKIEDLDNYIGSKGKRYKDHNKTLRMWLKKDVNNKASKQYRKEDFDLS